MDYIGIIDSGIGGLCVLKECCKLMKKQNFVYIADLKNAPYGNKNVKEIQKVVEENVYFLQENYNIKALIVACNTATSCCIKQLRQFFNFPIIGVEPAVRLAIKNNSEPVVILSTKATYKNNRIIRFYKKYRNVKCLPQKKLAKDIDNNLFNLNNVKNVHLSKKYKNVVLGCTHYCFIKKKFQSMGVKVFDSNKSVAEKVREVKRREKIQDCYKKREIKILSSPNYTIDVKLTTFFNSY